MASSPIIRQVQNMVAGIQGSPRCDASLVPRPPLSPPKSVSSLQLRTARDPDLAGCASSSVWHFPAVRGSAGHLSGTQVCGLCSRGRAEAGGSGGSAVAAVGCRREHASPAGSLQLQPTQVSASGSRESDR